MDVTITGLSRWHPLDLATDAEVYAEALAAQFPATPQIDLVAPGVAGFAGRLRREHEDGESYLLAAWLFLRSDELLDPLAHATLRGVRMSPEQSAENVVADLLTGLELYGEPVVEEIDTASGPATTAVFRAVQQVDGERVVQEHAYAVWPRSADGYAVLLSGVSADLVDAHEMPAALRQLAEGVSGL